MGLLTRKRSVKLEEFCREYYETYVYNLSGAEKRKTTNIIYDGTLNSIQEADSELLTVRTDLFYAVMDLLRIELFALAWIHKFGEKSAIKQGSFTKKYLYEKNKENIWRALQPFDEAVKEASLAVYNPEKSWARTTELTIIKVRADQWTKAVKDGYDSEAAERALGRSATDQIWKGPFIPRYLVVIICKSLSHDLNDECQQRMTDIIRDFYSLALREINKIALLK